MARMNHPNIVTVYDFGQIGDLYYLLMEYVDGVNLRQTLRAGRLAPREALAIVPQICDALQYAHDQGVVHRDIKPENVLLDRSGRIKIADFGLAKLLGKGPDDFTLTHTQQVMGTPRYMAPEQIERPSSVDHRADIYSLGVVLYEMLTGELPLGRFDPPSQKVQVDVRIDQVVLRALEKSPDRRYQRASEVKTELASAASWPLAALPPAHASAPAHTPIWQTPAPATKYDSGGYPAGVPLGQVLGVAIGMIVGVLVATASLAMLIYGMIVTPALSGAWWGWVGGAFGGVIGGLGSLAGSYNTYRQLAGAEDLMRSPRVTWFDWMMRGYLVVGLLVLGVPAVAHLAGSDPGRFWPLYLLGGIATLQSALFVAWRMLIRMSVAGQVAAEPGYLQAIAWPTLAMAGLWLLAWADVYYSAPAMRPGEGGITRRIEFFRDWQQGVVLSGLVAVPLFLLVLAGWRTWGPRHALAGQTPRVPFPFAAPGWLWGVAGLALLSLVLPWFRLEIEPGAEAVLSAADVFHESDDRRGAGVSTVVTAEHLKNIAAMPAGWRYAHRGIQLEPAFVGAALLVFAVVMGTTAFRRLPLVRVIFLLAFGTVPLLMTTSLLHNAAQQRESLVVDDTTEEGLLLFASRTHGQQPQTVAPWRRSIATEFRVRPAVGMFVSLAACALAIFFGVTEWCWAGSSLVAPPAPEQAKDAAAATRPAVTPLDPVREAIRRRVAGPAIGLIVAGLLNLAPLLLALLAIPARTDTFHLGACSGEFPGSQLSLAAAPAFQRFPVVAAHPSLAATPGLPGRVLPFLLAQASPDASTTAWALVLMVLFVGSLATSVVLIVGGWQMMRLRWYGLAIIAAIVALLPCSVSWLIGLPIGIWALVVLNKPEVREAFQS
jgi:hypothetical protein